MYSYPQNLLESYIQNPNDSDINFDLGLYYLEIGQTASAVSFFVRSAERTSDTIHQYECMLKAAQCFEIQGSRNDSVIGMYQHAVSLIPTLPHAYYLLSRYYEKIKKWFDGYTMASIALKVTYENWIPFKTYIDYQGRYSLLFQKGVLGWWCGLCDESKNIFLELMYNHPLDENHKNLVINNLKFLKAWKNDNDFVSSFKTKEEELKHSKIIYSLYTNEDYESLKIQFLKSEKIKRNYSEAFQDMFVLSILNGMESGTYVEIGSGYPFFGNNTYLLENEYDWKGLSIDITKEAVERHFRDRNHFVLNKDATEIDYNKEFKNRNFDTIINYLQIDCDPSDITYNVLMKIPFDTYKFSVITYEHDYYKYQNDENFIDYRKLSREFLKSKGYELVISDVSTNGQDSFEDWYVMPELVDMNLVNKIKDISDNIKTAKNIILKN